jgi:hypothetical protein
MQEEIKRAYEHWKNALAKTDLSALEKLHADNFSWTNSLGITCNKPEYLFKISSGNVRYISLTDGDIKIIVEHNKATVSTTQVLNMFVYERMVCVVLNITATFQFCNGEWLLSKIEERKNAA